MAHLKPIQPVLFLALCILAAGCADAVLVDKLANPPTVPLADASADAEAKRFNPLPDKATTDIIREEIVAGQAIQSRFFSITHEQEEDL